MMPIFDIILSLFHEISKPYTWIILLVASIYLIHRLTNSRRSFSGHYFYL